MLKSKLKFLQFWPALVLFHRNFSSRCYCNLTAFSLNKGFINGEWVDARNGALFGIRNPATNDIIGCVPSMTIEDTLLAIAAAKRAFISDEWLELTGRDRSNLLKRWHHLISQNTSELANLITAESGKPINEAKAEIAYGNSFIEWFAEEAPRVYGEIIPSTSLDREILVMKFPLGVVAMITPWNFPMALYVRKAAAALAAGCTVIVKPSEETPLSTLAVTKLAKDAGFPKGVINVVTCTKKEVPNIGEIFCKSPDIDGISFTGSTSVGRLLYRSSAHGIKRISLELGGNAPFIVFESADLKKAVAGAIMAKFRNCGQTCVSANRFFVQERIYDDFVEALKESVEGLRVGNGSDPNVQIGPLINEMQFNKVCSFVEDALNKNGKLITGGKSLPELGPLFYAPTIIADVDPSAKIYQQEVFGPVVSIIKFKTELEAVCKANESLSGLAGYFYSQNFQQIFRVAKRLEVGMVGINAGMISTAEAPFGGVKESGIGREGSHYGIDEYVEIKYFCLADLKYSN